VIGRLVVGFAVSVSATGECIYISEIAPAVCIAFILGCEQFESNPNNDSSF